MIYVYSLIVLLLLIMCVHGVERGLRCPFEYHMPDGAFCKQYRIKGHELTFYDCDSGRTYVNPYPWSPVETCPE